MRISPALTTLIFSIGLGACRADDPGLAKVHADIVSDLPSVRHISPDDLMRIEKPIMLDIREPSEYAVSHINGAVRVDPGITETDLHALIGNVEDRDIIVYCSVGRRSSIFAGRMSDSLMALGAKSVSNLENGIFGWHNENRELVDADGTTDVVHPYNEVWKRYVMRKDKVAYTPK